MTIQIWIRYEFKRYGRKKQRMIEKERQRKMRFMITRVTHRALATTFTPWKTWFLQAQLPGAKPAVTSQLPAATNCQLHPPAI